MAMYHIKKQKRKGVAVVKRGLFGDRVLKVSNKRGALALKKKAGKKNPAQRHRYKKKKGLFSL
jgi:hypothetical protein